MTNQLQALKELSEKVEGGEHVATMYFSKCWNTGFGWGYNACNHGSLDAAHSLHKAVLGDRWKVAKIMQHGWYCVQPEHFNDMWTCVLGRPSKEVEINGLDSTPARAWLLAIIYAKISELER